MKLRYRRLVYLIFFLIFFSLAPLLILYATGYRYNFKKNQLEKTGILALDSRPRKAAIYLDGKYKNTTPTRLTRLLPNKYNILISKDGYYPWIKEVEVKSNLTTFFKDIILFKKNLPVIKIEGEINILVADPDHKKIIYSILKNNTEELRLLNLKNGSDFLIEKFNRKTYSQLEFSGWSSSQNKALIKQIIGDFNKYLILNIETLKIKELFSITRLNFETIIWDDINDSYLYGLRKTVLYQINLADKKTFQILSDKITSFQIKQEKIYYITKLGSEYFLNRRGLNGGSEKEEKIKLISPSNYTFQSSPPDFIILLDKKNNDLFIIKEQIFENDVLESEIVLAAKAKDIIWSEDFKKLLYYNNFELWFYDGVTKQNKLINRYSKVINQAVFYPENNYIIYQLDDTIRITEIKEGGLKNDIALAKLSEVNKIIIDSEGENIYFQGQVGGKLGIFQLTIQ